MGVDVLMKDNEAVGVNILTKVYCSGEVKKTRKIMNKYVDIFISNIQVIKLST